MKDTILVTGGAGYIGSHVCKALSRAGYTPVTFDNLSRGHRRAVKWGPFVQGDILDAAALDAAFLEHSPVAIMHFAALAYVGESVTQPDLYYRNNVVGSLNLLDAAVRHKCSSMVFSSTCAVYGQPDAAFIREDMAEQPINPYGRTKLMIEQAMRDYGAASGLRHVALRYFNAAGADVEGEIGEEHDPETHAIPLVINAARDGSPTFKVFGSDYPTPDGTAVRDYIHVEDLAEAHILALKYLLDGGGSVHINLGTGTGNSVLEIIRAVEKVSGQKVPFALADRRAGDPAQLVAESGRATELLGWRPRFTKIEEIIATAWRWHSRR